METMKKQWGKALVGIQEFVPSEYCVPCGDGATEVTYYFMCDGGFATGHYDVWKDVNKNGIFDTHVEHHGPTIIDWDGWDETVIDEELLTPRTYYHPCGFTHTVTVPKGTNVDDIFPYGFITPDGQTSPVTQVRYYHATDGTGYHCTTTLKSSEFTPHNPS